MRSVLAQIQCSTGLRRLFFGALAWAACAAAPSLSAQAVPDVRIIQQPDGPLVGRHWTARSGLPVNQITGMIKGSDGYLWLSTFDGLVRFDGVRFTLFNKGRTPTLPSARFSELLGDWGGAIWLRTEAGHLIAFEGDGFRDYTPQLESQLLVFFVDDADQPWAGTADGFFRMDGNAWTRVPIGDGGGVSAIIQAAPGVFWIARIQGAIQRFHLPSEEAETLVTVDSGPEPIRRLTLDDAGALWAAGNTGAFRILMDSIEFYPVAPGVGWPIAVIPPSEGRGPLLRMEAADFRLERGRWIPLMEGDPEAALIPAIRTQDGALWRILEKSLVRNGRLLTEPQALVDHLLLDSEGSIWVAGTSGLHQFRPAAVESLALEDSGESHQAYALHEGPSGSLWVTATGPGVLSGLWRVRDRDAELVLQSPSRDFHTRIEMAVLEDRRGELWVALDRGGVCRLEAFRCNADGFFSLNEELVRAIHEARDGTLWFGTTHALYRRSLSGTWMRFGAEDGLPEVTIRAITETPDGHLWLGTQRGGVIYWDGQNFRQVSLEEGLPTRAVRGLHLDAVGILWVGTEGLGLSRLERAGELADGSPHWRISTIRQADGLFDDGIHQIIEDASGRFWMSSNRGLFHVQRTELEAFFAGSLSQVRSTKFDERDGLLDRELNGGVQGAGLMLRDGRLVFPGMGGLGFVRSSGGGWNHPPPPVRVEEVRVGGQHLFAGAGAIRLPRGDRDLEIAFAGLSFWTPEAIVFRYRLRGLDDGWREVVGPRSAFYTNLSGGRYVFEVQASSETGVWSPVPATLELVIPYRPHEHPFAQAGFGLFLLLGLVGMVRFRERQLRSQAERLEHLVSERTRVVESQAERLLELDRMKSRLFEDISHELRTPLTLIVAPLEGVRDGLPDAVGPSIRRDVDVALQNSRRLLDLVAQILDLARLEAGRLPVRMSPLDSGAWIHHQALAFSPLAETKGIKLRTEIPKDLPVLWSSPDLFQKMLGNLISNAIKFTPDAGVVRVRSWASEDHLLIEVRDSGPGISAERIETLFQRFSESFGTPDGNDALPSTRIGLSLANQLAELHGGGIEVRSEEGFGATFVLKLRLGSAHLPDHVDVDTEQGAPARPPEVMEAVPSRTSTEKWDGAGQRQAADVNEATPESGAPLVLIVEDHPDVRTYLQVLLGGTYQVRAATHGKEALAMIQATPPDLIVSDLRMPELDGLGLLSAIRTQDQSRTDGLVTPFLLISAHDDAMDRATAYQMGASDFMTKPFSPKDLMARISGLLANQTLLEQRRPVLKVSASEVSIPSASASFLSRVAQVVEDHLGDADFGATELARALGYSRSGLYRKLEEVGESSPAQILQRMRLDRAAQLLADGTGSVSRIGFQCGFRTVSHFSRAFKAQFGVPPSQYVASASTETEG